MFNPRLGAYYFNLVIIQVEFKTTQKLNNFVEYYIIIVQSSKSKTEKGAENI